jgi:hypothetical protein
MPIHCHTCTCTKIEVNRQYGPDPKVITVNANGSDHEIGIKHPLYMKRYVIMNRCYKASSKDFKNYQGKGISVFEQWRTSAYSFYKWCLENGWKRGLQIDRIDPNGNYEPNNCQFLTPSEHGKKNYDQSSRIGSPKLSIEEVCEIRELLKTIPVKDLASRFKVCKTTIRNIRSGKSWIILKKH